MACERAEAHLAGCLLELESALQSGLGVASAKRAVANATWAEQEAFEDAQMAAYDSSSDEEEMR